MLKPVEKPTSRPLVHHPSDVLDLFCQYDNSNLPWVEFNRRMTAQVHEFEQQHQHFVVRRARRRDLGRQ